jgi:hypothetical protein
VFLVRQFGPVVEGLDVGWTMVPQIVAGGRDVRFRLMTAAEIVADFPELSDNHIRAALEFAADRERRLAESA